jgi:hypothetical protein
LKVPKESNTYVVKFKKYDSGTPEDFLKWRLILNEQMKNNGSTTSYDMVMNLAQAMLARRGLESFVSERRSQEAKKRIRKVKYQTMHTPNHIWLRNFWISNPRSWHPKWMERCLWMAERIYEKRSFHGENQPRKVQSKTARPQQVFGLHPNWKK